MRRSLQRSVLCVPILALFVAAAALAASAEEPATLIRGTVVSVDTDAKTLVVKLAEGGVEPAGDVVLRVDQETKIVEEGREVELSAVTAGERVSAAYRKVNGTNLALTITVDATVA